MGIHFLLPFLRKSLRSCATPVIRPRQIRCQEATEEIQKESKLQPFPRFYSFGSSYTTVDGRVNNIKFASYLMGNRPLTCKSITERQLPLNRRTIFHVIHLKA